MLKAMVSTEFLRGFLGLLGLGCAFMAGRTTASVRKSQVRSPRLYAWLIRTVLCMLALSFRHPVDTLSIAIWTLALLAFVGGYWQATNQKPPEDLSSEIVPHDAER
jgi:hypothetical protein